MTFSMVRSTSASGFRGGARTEFDSEAVEAFLALG